MNINIIRYSKKERDQTSRRSSLQYQNERTFNFFQTEKPDNKEEEASLVVKFINRNEKNHKMVSIDYSY